MSYVKHVWEDGDELSTEQINEISATLEEVDLRDYFEIGKENQATPLNLPNNGLFFKYVRVNENLHTYEILKYVDGNLVPLPLDAFTVKGRDICAEFDALDLDELTGIKDTVNDIITGTQTVGGSYSIVTSQKIESDASFIWRTTGGEESLTTGKANIIIIGGHCSTPQHIEEYLKADQHLVEFSVSVDALTFATSVGGDGTYTFNYNINWFLNDTQINLTEYGIFVSNSGYNIGDTIKVTLSDGSITSAEYNRVDILGEVNINLFKNKIVTTGTYNFVYSNPSWYLDGQEVVMSEYGLTIINSPVSGDYIECKYQEGYIEDIKVASPTKFISVGLNAFNKDVMIIENAGFSEDRIIPIQGSKLGFCKIVGDLDNGYVVYSKLATIQDIKVCEELPEIYKTVSSTGVTLDPVLSVVKSTKDVYVVFSASSFDDVCIHPQWSGIQNYEYEPYYESVIELPIESIDGIMLPLGIGYFPSVGDVRDYIDVVAKKYYKWINRIPYSRENLNAVIASGQNYIYDLNYIYYVLQEPVVYNIQFNGLYEASDFGTEKWYGTEYSVYTKMKYLANLVDKLRIDVLTISEQDLTDNQRQQVWANLGLYDLTEEGF